MPTDAPAQTFVVSQDWKTTSRTGGGALGVRGDKDVDVVRIVVPRVVAGVDLSGFKARVHYVNAGGVADFADPVAGTDGDSLTFDWTLGSLACAREGEVAFSLELTEYGEGGEVLRRLNSARGCGTIQPAEHSDSSVDEPAAVDLIQRLEGGMSDLADARDAAEKATSSATASAADARKAAEEARGAVGSDKRIYYMYETVGDTRYLTLVEMDEED